jgi:DNA-binding NarL/FixJ family response regulator
MTIYVLDSHPLMCQSISFLLLRIDPSKKVIEVRAYSKLREVLLINGQPELFVIEPLAIGISGTAGIKQIKNNYPDTPLILFSSIPSAEWQDACIAAGADLYIEKTTPLKDTLKLISDHLQASKNSGFKIQNEQHPEGLVKLSKRQKQLLILVDSGLSNEDIANRLEISAHTVKVHLWRFYKKLGISSRTQLVKFARDNGYL